MRRKHVAQALVAEGKKWEVLTGDVEQVCKSLEEDSFDAVLCDPPYGLSFMGKGWDHDVPSPELWKEVLRVLRPGAPCVAFSGTRTYHRMAWAIERAGFDVVDMFSWIYGQGWPKGLDLSKAVDKHLGAERKVVGHRSGIAGSGFGNVGHGLTSSASAVPITEPATEQGRLWNGYNTQLKPAQEPAAVFFKPRVGTFAENAIEHGVGGFNIDASRVGESGGVRGVGFDPDKLSTNEVYGKKGKVTKVESAGGRYPTNVLFDGEAHGELPPEQREFFPAFDHEPGEVEAFELALHRYFYAAKAPDKERGSKNDHPTVKPIALMKYLATMLRPPKPNGRVLVPFCGSGSEMTGCLLAGWSEVVGIELDPRMADVARWRISNFRVNRTEVVVGGSAR